MAASAALAAGVKGSFDIILANHVFYYVPGLQDQLARLIFALSPAGVFVTAIAARTNPLIEFWIAAFRLLGREIPYNTSEDVAAALQELGADYQKQQVAFELTFPDTEENRMHIIRFLLADHLAQLPLRLLLEWFDRHHHSGRIEIRMASEHFTIRSERGHRPRRVS
jgi:SAM-dependent methyltransferase